MKGEIKKSDKQVYWDNERKMLYWIEWIYTGNNDIPNHKRHYIKRHYIEFVVKKGE